MASHDLPGYTIRQDRLLAADLLERRRARQILS